FDRSDVLMALGDLAGAGADLERAIRLAEGNGNKRPLAWCLAGLAGIRCDQGDFARASELLERSIAIGGLLKDADLSIETALVGSRIALGLGDLPRASGFVNAAVSEATHLGEKAMILSGLRLRGVVFREQGRWAEAIESLERSLQLSEEIGAMPATARAHFELGLIPSEALARVDVRTHLVNACAIFEKTGMILELARARAALDALPPG
ncbi:MAG: tetratricopeptide repeat protein, partial [Thermoplasmata archaeon]|nr:tetratricopeptide repeat protein [Thermoplasmata archaeon]